MSLDTNAIDNSALSGISLNLEDQLTEDFTIQQGGGGGRPPPPEEWGDEPPEDFEPPEGFGSPWEDGERPENWTRPESDIEEPFERKTPPPIDWDKDDLNE